MSWPNPNTKAHNLKVSIILKSPSNTVMEKAYDEYVKDAEGTSSARSTNNQEERDEIKEVKKLSQADTKWVRFWRFVVFGVISFVAVAVTLTTYTLLKRQEDHAFKTAFDQFSRTVRDAAVTQQFHIREAATSFADDVAIVAKATNQTFPFVTFPDFELRAGAARTQGRIEMISIGNIVSHKNADSYIDYISARYEKVSAEGRFYNPVVNASFEPIQYSPYIAGAGFDPDIPRDQYFPLWTLSPPQGNYRSINWNPAFMPEFKALIEAMLVLKNETVFTRVRPYAAFDKEQHKLLHTGGQDPDEFPHSFFFHPIYEKPRDPTSPIVSFLAGTTAWDSSMQNLLPIGVAGIVCVLKNSFNQTYSYKINGPDALFIGEGDKHDQKYDDVVRVVDLSPNTHPAFHATTGHGVYEMVSRTV